MLRTGRVLYTSDDVAKAVRLRSKRRLTTTAGCVLWIQAAADFFGANTDLAGITSEALTRWVDVLRKTSNGRGGTLSETSVRKYLNSVSNLFKRALSERYVKLNPVAAMYCKPTETKTEAPYLSPEEAALLMESARTYLAPLDDGAFGHMYPLLATVLLTGGRKSEVFGLEVDDVSLRVGKVYFRPNQWRGLKTRGSKRTVPLWPQPSLPTYVRHGARKELE